MLFGVASQASQARLARQQMAPRRSSVTVAARHDAAPAAASRAPRDELSRRSLLLAGAAATCSTLLLPTGPAEAIQGSIAGRIPGITGPDADGFLTYTRPEGKSGGHGVGWSEMPRYSFQVPAGWEEVPVSIADLGGTEIDLRFDSDDQGKLQVVVAPVLRFREVGRNADVRLDELVTPQRMIEGFAPELYGKPITEEDVIETRVEKIGGVPYYFWELRPHNLVAATAVGNRVFILAVTANGRQWRKGEEKLRHIQNSFYVPPFSA